MPTDPAAALEWLEAFYRGLDPKLQVLLFVAQALAGLLLVGCLMSTGRVLLHVLFGKPLAAEPKAPAPEWTPLCRAILECLDLGEWGSCHEGRMELPGVTFWFDKEGYLKRVTSGNDRENLLDSLDEGEFGIISERVWEVSNQTLARQVLLAQERGRAPDVTGARLPGTFPFPPLPLSRTPGESVDMCFQVGDIFRTYRGEGPK